MSRDEVIRDILLSCNPQQRAAISALESRGLTFCAHFGTENAIEILADMDRAADLGILYEWMNGRLGMQV